MNYVRKFRVAGDDFSLAKCDPGFHADLDEPAAIELQAKSIAKMRALQDKLYAEQRQALLIVLQALDAAGKDSTIKHVMSGINPAGCAVYSFKAPSAEELRHDYLWRIQRCLPEQGKIGIYNRSHYEEVLAVRVHPELFSAQRLPLITVPNQKLWNQRFKEINAFEKYLSRNGTQVIKFFLHVSKDEQRKRFLERINDPNKNWKFSKRDVLERTHWDEYHEAYEDLLRHTSHDGAPWYVIPADRKWFTRTAVSEIIVEHLRELDPKYPAVTDQQRAELAESKFLLENEPNE